MPGQAPFEHQLDLFICGEDGKIKPFLDMVGYGDAVRPRASDAPGWR